jgi:hypothetical protein
MDTHEAIAQLKESCAANLNAYFGVNVSPDQIEEIDTNQGELEMLLGVCTIGEEPFGFAMTLGSPSVISMSQATTDSEEISVLFPFLGKGKTVKKGVGEIFNGDRFSCVVTRERGVLTISRIRD